MSTHSNSINMSTPLSSHTVNAGDNRDNDGGDHNPLNQGRPYEPPSTRKASLTTLKRTATASENEDDEEAAEPLPKRVNASKYNEHQHVYIGRHTDEPQIPIYASYKRSGGVHVRAFKENVPEEVLRCWSHFVWANSQVDLKKVKLDSELHSTFTIGNERLSNDAKKLLIKDYLESEGKVVQRGSKDTEKVSDEPRNTTGELHAGYFKHDEDIPVYAYLRNQTTNAALLFKVLKRDADRSDIEFSGYRIQ